MNKKSLAFKPFIKESGILIPLDMSNVDTDAIIPVRYLKRLGKSGYGDNLFDSLRWLNEAKSLYSNEGRKPNLDFVLNKLPYNKGKFLVARDNFGCGSSREHAVWALRDFGIRAVISASFSDIFFNNSILNGLLPIVLNKSYIDEIFNYNFQNGAYSLEIDLRKKIINAPFKKINFNLEDSYCKRLLNGLDEIAITFLEFKDKIISFEESHLKNYPWLKLNNE